MLSTLLQSFIVIVEQTKLTVVAVIIDSRTILHFPYALNDLKRDLVYREIRRIGTEVVKIAIFGLFANVIVKVI